MNTIRKLLMGTVFLIALSAKPAQASGPISLLGFQVAGIGVLEALDSAWFLQGSWTPSISMGLLGIRGEIGITSLQFPGGPRFLATNYEVLLQLPLFPGLHIEAGGGLHVWMGQLPAAMALTGNLVFPALIGLDRLFIGYTRFTGGAGANEIRLGLGFEI